jgi:polysaccharide biosynthesis/export protein
MKALTLFSMGLVLAALAGCQSEPKATARTRPAAARLAPAYTPLNNFTPVSVGTSTDRALLLEPSMASYTVGPGDRLEVEVLGDPTTHESVLVGPDGKIYFYLLPGIDVWGLTLTQVRQKLEDGLMNYMRGQAPVSITLREIGSKKVWILGRVGTPGIYPLTGQMTLLEALAEAGGPVTPTSVSSSGGPLGVSLTADIADLRHSFVMRDGHPLPVDLYRLLKMGDLSQNIYLQPDDFIYLPSSLAKEVYVLGAVGDPTSVTYHNQMTLVGAIAAARGTIRNAYLSHVAVLRGTLSNPQIAIVNYKAIVKGDEPNVALEPGDIVYVPYTPYRILTTYADLIVKTFVQTVAVNEGARAVSRNAGVVGVAIPSGGGGAVIGDGGGGGTVVGGGGGGGGNGGGGGL